MSRPFYEKDMRLVQPQQMKAKHILHNYLLFTYYSKVSFLFLSEQVSLLQ